MARSDDTETTITVWFALELQPATTSGNDAASTHAEQQRGDRASMDGPARRDSQAIRSRGVASRQ